MHAYGTATRLIKSIADKRDEASRLLRVLAMWCEVTDQGLEPESVRAFTFDEKLLNAADLVRLRREHKVRSVEFGGPQDHEFKRQLAITYHNVAILYSGERRTLDPMIARP